MMRRVLTAVLLVAAFAAGASAQQATRGTMTTAGQVVQLDTRGASTASIAVSGTWSGTVNFEVVAGGGTDPVTVDCATPAAPGTAVNNTTSGGVWVCPVAGMLAVQARLSDAPTGTVVVDIVSSPAPGQTVAAAGGGGGGNDAASATGSSVPASASYNAVNVGGTLRGQTGTSVGSHYAGAVQIMDGSGNAITSFGGGTQYTHDAALTVSTTVGTMAIGRASAAVPSDVSADGDAVIPWYLRSGAQAMQVTFGGVLATAGNGASGTGVQRVTLASDSTGNVATIGTSVTPGTSAAHLGKAEDAIAGNGDTGVAMLALREDTPTSTAASGDYIVPKTDSVGRLYANVAAMPADATELPAAAALADATSNPTVPGVAAFLMGWNGSTWDRVASSKDPCDGGTKVFVTISQTTSTQLFTGTASNRTYVCSIALVQPSGSTQTFSLVSGTGSVCATGTGAMMGATTAANGLQQSISHGAGSGSIAKSAANADNVCLLQSGTDRITGVISYVVAP